MKVRTYILFVILFALLGLCTVHAVVKQTQARYQMAELVAREEALNQELIRLRDVELEMLQNPERLKQLNQELNLGLRPLLSVEGESLNRVAVHSVR